jgi:hypothetical protein
MIPPGGSRGPVGRSHHLPLTPFLRSAAALGVIAVRTGSLTPPTAIHVAGHVMKDILR